MGADHLSSSTYGIALYPFDPKDAYPNSSSLFATRRGDIFKVLGTADQGWTLVLDGKETQGYIPTQYLHTFQSAQPNLHIDADRLACMEQIINSKRELRKSSAFPAFLPQSSSRLNDGAKAQEGDPFSNSNHGSQNNDPASAANDNDKPKEKKASLVSRLSGKWTRVQDNSAADSAGGVVALRQGAPSIRRKTRSFSVSSGSNSKESAANASHTVEASAVYGNAYAYTQVNQTTTSAKFVGANAGAVADAQQRQPPILVASASGSRGFSSARNSPTDDSAHHSVEEVVSAESNTHHVLPETIPVRNSFNDNLVIIDAYASTQQTTDDDAQSALALQTPHISTSTSASASSSSTASSVAGSSISSSALMQNHIKNQNNYLRSSNEEEKSEAAFHGDNMSATKQRNFIESLNHGIVVHIAAAANAHHRGPDLKEEEEEEEVQSVRRHIGNAHEIEGNRNVVTAAAMDSASPAVDGEPPTRVSMESFNQKDSTGAPNSHHSHGVGSMNKPERFGKIRKMFVRSSVTKPPSSQQLTHNMSSSSLSSLAGSSTRDALFPPAFSQSTSSIGSSGSDSESIHSTSSISANHRPGHTASAMDISNYASFASSTSSLQSSSSSSSAASSRWDEHLSKLVMRKEYLERTLIQKQTLLNQLEKLERDLLGQAKQKSPTSGPASPRIMTATPVMGSLSSSHSYSSSSSAVIMPSPLSLSSSPIQSLTISTMQTAKAVMVASPSSAPAGKRPPKSPHRASLIPFSNRMLLAHSGSGNGAAAGAAAAGGGQSDRMRINTSSSQAQAGSFSSPPSSLSKKSSPVPAASVATYVGSSAASPMPLMNEENQAALAKLTGAAASSSASSGSSASDLSSSSNSSSASSKSSLSSSSLLSLRMRRKSFDDLAAKYGKQPASSHHLAVYKESNSSDAAADSVGEASERAAIANTSNAPNGDGPSVLGSSNSSRSGVTVPVPPTRSGIASLRKVPFIDPSVTTTVPTEVEVKRSVAVVSVVSPLSSSSSSKRYSIPTGDDAGLDSGSNSSSTTSGSILPPPLPAAASGVPGLILNRSQQQQQQPQQSSGSENTLGEKAGGAPRPPPRVESARKTAILLDPSKLAAAPTTGVLRSVDSHAVPMFVAHQGVAITSAFMATPRRAVVMTINTGSTSNANGISSSSGTNVAATIAPLSAPVEASFAKKVSIVKASAVVAESFLKSRAAMAVESTAAGAAQAQAQAQAQSASAVQGSSSRPRDSQPPGVPSDRIHRHDRPLSDDRSSSETDDILACYTSSSNQAADANRCDEEEDDDDDDDAVVHVRGKEIKAANDESKGTDSSRTEYVSLHSLSADSDLVTPPRSESVIPMNAIALNSATSSVSSSPVLSPSDWSPKKLIAVQQASESHDVSSTTSAEDNANRPVPPPRKRVDTILIGKASRNLVMNNSEDRNHVEVSSMRDGEAMPRTEDLLISSASSLSLSSSPLSESSGDSAKSGLSVGSSNSGQSGSEEMRSYFDNNGGSHSTSAKEQFVPHRIYTYQELLSRPPDADARYLEEYLSPEEFLKLFGTSRENRGSIPRWKYNLQKKYLRLHYE